MFPCEYGVTLKAAVLKNICERLLLNGRHWYSTNEILKFYYWDKIEVSTFSFSWFFSTIYYFVKKFIYQRKNYCKYCWCMKQFLNVIKVLLICNPNYSSFFFSLLVGTRKMWCLIWCLNETWKPTSWNSWQSNLKT